MVKTKLEGKSPFKARFNASKQCNFDKFYIDRTVKTIFKSTGQKDEDGNDLGVCVEIVVDKPVDIEELLESQRDSVGIDAYIRALSLQGESINDFSTVVSDKVDDYSNLPDTLAEVMTAGDKAKRAFAEMDPALKGEHTTIEGFLNSLTKDTIDKYIAGKLEALNPVKKEGD